MFIIRNLPERIFKKLNVHSAVQLVRFAVLNDLLIDRAIADDLHHRDG